jgi:transcription factor-like protein
VDSTFWSHLVTQLAHEEPAVKSSIISLGALQRCSELKQEQEHSLALSYYAQAVCEAQELVRCASVSRDYAKVLVCAILFHCVESTLGAHVSAKTHLRGGLQLLYEKKLIDSDLRDIISNTYRRFDFQAMTFWDISAPYEFSLYTEARLRATSSPEHFSSLNHAANLLMDLAQWMSYVYEFYLGRFSPIPSQPASYAFQLGQCKVYLDAWHSRFEEYKAKNGTYSLNFRQTCRLLTILYLMILIRIRQIDPVPETQWDSSLPDYIRLLDLAEEFTAIDSQVFARGVASFEMGIVVPLFETAVRCRDPHQRRRAVAMLQSASRREGIWDSLGAAAVAQSVIDVEEEGLVKVERASDVPDQSRVYFLIPAADINKRTVHVTFFRRPRLSISASGDLSYEYDTPQQVVYF